MNFCPPLAWPKSLLQTSLLSGLLHKKDRFHAGLYEFHIQLPDDNLLVVIMRERILVHMRRKTTYE